MIADSLEGSSVSVIEEKIKKGRKKNSQIKNTKKERRYYYKMAARHTFRLVQNRESAQRFRVKRKQEYDYLKIKF